MPPSPSSKKKKYAIIKRGIYLIEYMRVHHEREFIWLKASNLRAIVQLPFFSLVRSLKSQSQFDVLPTGCSVQG